MKRFVAFAGVLFLTSSVLMLWGQTTTVAKSIDQEAEKELRRLNDEEVQSFLQKDPDAMARLWSDDLVVTNPLNKFVNKQAVLGMVKSGFLVITSYTRNIEYIRIYGDTAIVAGNEEVVWGGRMPNAGKTEHLRFTGIWMRQGGRWQQVARRANIVPEQVSSSSVQSGSAHTLPAANSPAKPLLLEQNEGELRTRRPRPQPSPASQFTLKIGPKINGSEHLAVGTEPIAQGASIPTHKHQTEDELLLIHSGTAHVVLGEQERDLHAGGLVFIPANTWIGLKNVSSESLDLTFVFSAPGFDDFQRCISVPAGDTPTPMTEAELRACQQQGHMIYRNADPTRN